MAPTFGNDLSEHFAVGELGSGLQLWVHGCYSRARRPFKFFATWPTS